MEIAGDVAAAAMPSNAQPYGHAAAGTGTTSSSSAVSLGGGKILVSLPLLLTILMIVQTINEKAATSQHLVLINLWRKF